MLFEIKNRWTGNVIFKLETSSMKLCVEAGVKARADLSQADLSQADLSQADLSRANLSRANLSQADLSLADLSQADLSRANLSQANLSQADLSQADLSWANLSRANLSQADLDFASWPLFCGGTRVKIDRHISLQLIYHAFNQAHQDQEIKEALEPLRALAEEFRSKHRSDAPELWKK